MAKKITIDIEVNGKMQKATLSAKKLRNALAEVDKQQENVSKSSREADRNIKGTAQASSNATKNFSKMAQGMGGLVGAYANLAASLFAVSAAFQFLKSAGELKSLQAGQAAYAAATGVAMKSITQDIIAATEAQVQFRDAAQGAAIGAAAGLNADQLVRLGKAAKDASQILGRDVTDAFNRLIRGATKAEPELLDELGIILRLERASDNYKNALNITGRELTAFERTQAVTNEILTQSEEKYSAILDIVGRSPNQYAQLGKAFDDIVMKVKEVTDAIVGPFANVLKDTPMLGVAAIGLLVSGPLGALGLSFGSLAEKAEEAATKQRAFYRGLEAEIKQARKTSQDYKKDLQGLAKVGMADGGKASFLTKMGAGKDLKALDEVNFKKAVDAAKNHVNSLGIVTKGAFTGMKIHMVNEMDEAFRNMRGEMDKTVSKTDLGIMRMRAGFASLGASIKAAGSQLVAFGAKLINILGYIGVFYTLYQTISSVFGDNTVSEEEKRAQQTQELTDKVTRLNKEYEHFIAIQTKLSGGSAGSNLFYRNMAGFLGAQSPDEFSSLLDEIQKAQNENVLGKTTGYSGGQALGIGAQILGATAAGAGVGAFGGLPGLLAGGVVGFGAGLYGAMTGNLPFASEDLKGNRQAQKDYLEQQKRLIEMQKGIRAAEGASGIAYRPMQGLDSAIQAFRKDGLKKPLEDALAVAIKFSNELQSAAQRSKMIQDSLIEVTKQYAPVSAEEQLADNIDAQITSLLQEYSQIAPGTGSERRDAIQKEIEQLGDARVKLRNIDERAHKTDMARLNAQKNRKREVFGELPAARELRNLENQKLDLLATQKGLEAEKLDIQDSARLKMKREGFQGSLQEYLRTSAGTEFQRALEKVKVKININEDDLAENVSRATRAGVLKPLEESRRQLQDDQKRLQLESQITGLIQKAGQARIASYQAQEKVLQYELDTVLARNPDASQEDILKAKIAVERQVVALRMKTADDEFRLKSEQIDMEEKMLIARNKLAQNEYLTAMANRDQNPDEGILTLFSDVESAIIGAASSQRTAAELSKNVKKSTADGTLQGLLAALEDNELLNALDNTMKTSFRDSLTDTFVELGMGGSGTEALRKMGQNIWKGVLTEASRRASRAITDFIFGKDDPAADMEAAMSRGAEKIKTAHEAGGDYVARKLAEKCGCSSGGNGDSGAGDVVATVAAMTAAEKLFEEQTDLTKDLSSLKLKELGEKLQGMFSGIGGALSQLFRRLGGVFSGGRGSKKIGTIVTGEQRSEQGYTMHGGEEIEEVKVIAKSGQTISGSFELFAESFKDIFDFNTQAGFIEKLGNVFYDGGNVFAQLFSGLMSKLGGLFSGGGEGGGLKGLFSSILGMFGGGGGQGGGFFSKMFSFFGGLFGGGAAPSGRYGGKFTGPAMFRYGGVSAALGYGAGGIARGTAAGYPAILHGTEAVVPLPNGRSIPVEMSGSGSSVNNVSVSVNVDNNGNGSVSTNSANELGAVIGQAVQIEIQKQKRHGGLLSPYGAK